MLTLKFNSLDELNAKLSTLFLDELGDKPAGILAAMIANNLKVDNEVLAMLAEAEEFVKTAPKFLQTGIMEQTQKAIEDHKTTSQYQNPLPTVEEIGANLLEDKIAKIREALGVEEKVVKTRTRKTGNGDASFNDQWAVKFPNKIMAVNFRKLSESQKKSFGLTNASQWLVFSEELGYKVGDDINSPTALVKLAYVQLAGGSANYGRHPFDSAKNLTEQDITKIVKK